MISASEAIIFLFSLMYSLAMGLETIHSYPSATRRGAVWSLAAFIVVGQMIAWISVIFINGVRYTLALHS